ncbi:MAG: putative DNA binding domain-containing protein [Victivallales bacterium]|nr:putative DNA binding domain-containing protein [Victivallales bacterium]
MTYETIVYGESKNTEFKEMLPNNSEKYTKTVIAYANSQGGKLIFGVIDETREIVGIDESILFHTMDSIANAISDCCEPQIVPDIEPCMINGKTVVVVTVSPEPHRPYYLKSKGKERGTYIRVGGTTRAASLEKIKELEMEGARISWDELTCVGFPVSEKAIEKLCRDMNRYRKEMQKRKELKNKLPKVTKTNLEDWNLLKKTADGYLASNAFALLTSSFFPFAKTQCAVFKGTDRAFFLDKREYIGPIYKQIDEAEDFVLRNIRLGVQIDGLIRHETYELPPEAIREMIVNAHCHRNMTDESCVQVAIFDDRLEVTSPGGLYNGLTFEEAMHGHSKLRNRTIANVFNQMGLIEAWGTGLQRIRDAATEYGLLKPEFIEMPDMFRVNLYRKSLLPGSKLLYSNLGTSTIKITNTTNTDSSTEKDLKDEAINEGVSQKNEGVNHNLDHKSHENEGVNQKNEGINQNLDHKSHEDEPINGYVYEPVNTAAHSVNEGVNSLFLHNILKKEEANDGVNRKSEGVNEVYVVICENPGIRTPRIVGIVGKSRATIERAIAELKSMQKIEFRGAPKNGGYYMIMKSK